MGPSVFILCVMSLMGLGIAVQAAREPAPAFRLAQRMFGTLVIVLAGIAMAFLLAWKGGR